MIDRLGMYEEARIRCPIIALDDIYDIIGEMLMSRKYRPEPYKLVEHNGYNPYEIKLAVERIRIMGAGKHMTEVQLERLEKEALQRCQEVRSGWTFKREGRPDEMEEESDFMDSLNG
jgi:hypothetical protein